MNFRSKNSGFRVFLTMAAAAAFLLVSGGGTVIRAQQSAPPPQQGQPPNQTQDQSAPDAGGPGGDNGAIALPKKKEKEAEPPPPAEPKVKAPPGLTNFSMRVDVPVVTVDVSVVLEKTHQFVPGLKQPNFRVYEDGVPQEIASFQRVQAPINALLLCEFAANSYAFIYDMRNAAYAFAQQLKPDDYIAVRTYDMNVHKLTDFTQDKRVLAEALNSLQIPGFRETNLFDALYTSLDWLSQYEGRKYIILIANGRDTFSKITLDKVLAKIRSTPDVTIFAVSTGGAARVMSEPRMGAIREMDYLQADNQMRTFASMTGGMSFFPRFEAEMPEIFHTINDTIRSQYSISYKPTNAKLDGTWRKVHVELVDDEGKPLHMQDEKHHQLKYEVIARDGYRAKHEVE